MNDALQVARSALRYRRRGAALAFHGPTGAGKSFAAQRFMRQAAVPALTFPATASLASWPAALPGARKLPAWVEGALQRLPDGDEALAALAARLSASAPLIVLAEDLHLAPTEQVARLCRLAERVVKLPGVVLLATTREEIPAGFTGVDVSPLSQADVRMLLHAELGAGVPEMAADWLYARARGNPLFTLEFLHFLVRSGHLYSDGQRWHWRVPEDARVPGRLEALIALTLKGAGEQRAVLEARAMVPEAPPEVWAAVAGLAPAELETACRALRERGLLVGEALAHPLFAEVLLLQAGVEDRQRLSRRALDAYASLDPVRAVAFLSGAQLDPAAEADLLGRASEQAHSSGLVQQAGRLLARLSDLKAGPQRAETALQAARLLQGSDLPRALELARTALRDPALTAQAAPIATAVSARIGGQDALSAVLNELAAVQADPPVDMLHAQVQALMTVGDHAGVVALQEQIRAAPPRADVALGYALSMSLLALGRPQEAEQEVLGLWRPDLPEASRIRLGGLRVMLLFNQAKYHEAADAALEVIQMLEASGNLLSASGLRHNRAAFLRMLGEFDGALENVEQAMATRRSLGDLRGYASSLGLRGELELERGHLDAAEDALTEGLELLGYLEASQFQANTHATLSAVYAHSDAPTAPALALHHAERAVELARKLRNPSLEADALAAASVAQTVSGRAEQALALADEAVVLEAQLPGSPRHQVQGRVARGRALVAGQVAEGLRELREAEQLARTHLSAYEADKICVEISRLEGNQAALEGLLAGFQEKGQGLGVLLARRALQSTSATLPASPEPAGQLSVLGPLSVNGKPVKGGVRRTLLLRLLAARLTGRAEVTRLDLSDELYPGQPEPQALDALKRAVSGLRAAYGREFIQTTSGGYALGSVQSDAETFLAAPDTRLWHGPCPPELDADVLDTLHRVLLTAAGTELEADPSEATRAGRLVLESDPLSETALKLTLRAMRRGGNHRSLERLYGQAQARFSEVGVQLPAKWADYLDGT